MVHLLHSKSVGPVQGCPIEQRTCIGNQGAEINLKYLWSIINTRMVLAFCPASLHKHERE